MPAMQYRRRADDILQGLWHMLRLAHSNYFSLQKANLEELCEDERARYGRAHESCKEETQRMLPNHPTPPAPAPAS
jgi:hypothetical protein